MVSDRLLLDLQYAHVGNNFILGFHSPELTDVEPSLIISTGLNGRSATASTFIRPVNSLNFNANYFLPSTLGSGSLAEDSAATGATRTPRRSPTPAASRRSASRPRSTNDCSLAATGCQADLSRDGYSVYDLLNYSAYVQDTITHGRFTAQLGIRYDYNKDTAQAANIVANPLSTTWLPAIASPAPIRAWRSTTSRRASA